MNEKIRGLLIEAKELTTEGNWKPPTHVWADKFAELIIRECQMALKPELRDMISRGKAYDLIKEHFGVE